MDDAKVAIEKLHQQGPKTIVVSSMEIENKLTAIVSNLSGKYILITDNIYINYINVLTYYNYINIR